MVWQMILFGFPTVDTGLVFYPYPSQRETLMHADIAVGGDTIRVYTTHLQSVRFHMEDYERIQEIKNRDDSMLQNSRSIFHKLRRGIVLRAAQADIAKQQISRSPHPFIITGDFNDVPNSYTYFTISKGLQDAFLKKGFGVGRTFRALSPTLR